MQWRVGGVNGSFGGGANWFGVVMLNDLFVMPGFHLKFALENKQQHKGWKGLRAT